MLCFNGHALDAQIIRNTCNVYAVSNQPIARLHCNTKQVRTLKTRIWGNKSESSPSLTVVRLWVPGGLVWVPTEQGDEHTLCGQRACRLKQTSCEQTGSLFELKSSRFTSVMSQKASPNIQYIKAFNVKELQEQNTTSGFSSVSQKGLEELQVTFS